MNNQKHKEPKDSSVISLMDDWEVKYWTGALGCSVMQLKAAVDAVGHSTARVREYLKKK